MSAAGTGALAPVQVQKMFFILDEEVLKSPCFDFKPYDYGPFDPAVYQTIEGLADKGLAKTDFAGKYQYRTYALTSDGLESGREQFELLPDWVQEFIADLVDWIKPLSFGEIVAYIYEHYPTMRVNSVFQSE